MTNGLMGDGAVLAYHNEAMTQEAVYQTAGGNAETLTGGVNMNLIPKDGGNQFRGGFKASNSPERGRATTSPTTCGRSASARSTRSTTSTSGTSSRAGRSSRTSCGSSARSARPVRPRNRRREPRIRERFDRRRRVGAGAHRRGGERHRQRRAEAPRARERVQRLEPLIRMETLPRRQQSLPHRTAGLPRARRGTQRSQLFVDRDNAVPVAVPDRDPYTPDCRSVGPGNRFVETDVQPGAQIVDGCDGSRRCRRFQTVGVSERPDRKERIA